jgi:hypothetical protein
VSRLHHAMPSLGARFVWHTFWRKAREARLAASARPGVRIGMALELRALRAQGGVASAAVDCLIERWERAWPQLDPARFYAWCHAGRPGTWAEFKRDHRARAVAMQRLAAAVRSGERKPGGAHA